MKSILLQIQADHSVPETFIKGDVFYSSIWFYIAIVELLIIAFLFWRLMKKPESSDLADISKAKVREAKKSNINMNDLMDNINGARNLYKTLSSRCHPDRFVNSDKQELAQEIFQGISDNKRDFRKLTEIKQRAEKELNINF